MSLQAVKASPKFAKLLDKYKDRDWRINNLYFVVNEHGQTVRYERRAAQKAYAAQSWVLDIIVKARQLGFCLSPDTPVLTSDLKWVRIEDLKVGASIMAVDEHAPKTRGSARKLRIAKVEKVWEVFEEAFEIEFETGLKVVATGPHRFLRKQRGGCVPEWRRVQEMRVGDVIRAVTDLWGESTVEDGWFGGLLDGEGSMRQKAAGGLEICIAQVDGAVLDRARKYLEDNHFHFREEIDRRSGGRTSKLGKKPVHKLVLHRASDVMRLLGKTRPSRFNRQWWEGRKMPADGMSWCKIVALRSLGKRRMIDMQTSEKTFIAAGLVSHNSTEIAIDITDLCVFCKNQNAGIVDYTLDDAKKKLEKIKFAYLHLPEEIRRAVRLTKDNESELWWSNGSKVRVGTTHRGGTLQFLHVSEYGKIATDKPDVAAEIKTGAFNTITPGMRMVIESTAHGTEGEFYRMVQLAEAKQREGTQFSVRDFRLHFFGWWMDPKYRLPVNSVIVPQELHAYFDMLKLKHGIKLDGEQKAWYAVEHKKQGDDDMHSEYPSTYDECFKNSLLGTFFKVEMNKARKEGRIGGLLPHDPTRRVHTAWDKGINPKSDQNAIVFFQTDGVRFRFINYYENAGMGLSHYIAKVDEIGKEHEYLYGHHYGPHDIEKREYAADARSIADIALQDYAFRFTIVPRVLDKRDAIEEGRRLVSNSWFDAEKCARLVECLDNYRRVWNKQLAQWTDQPLHNWASNGTDAYLTAAVGTKPEKDRPKSSGRYHGGDKPRSQWTL